MQKMSIQKIRPGRPYRPSWAIQPRSTGLPSRARGYELLFRDPLLSPGPNGDALPAVTPALMPVRAAAGKGEVLRVVGDIGAVGAAAIVYLVYVGLPLLVFTDGVVHRPVVAAAVAALTLGGVLRVLVATGFRASQGSRRRPSELPSRRPVDLKEESWAPSGARPVPWERPVPVPGVRPGGPGNVLAPRGRGTLYLRDVPDEVVRRLERLALRDGTSVGVVAVRELAEASRRADDPELLGSLPDLGVARP